MLTSMYLPTRTSTTSRKPREARPCLTVMPCGSLTTGLGVTITRAIMGRAPGGIATSSFVSRLGREQRLADDALVTGQAAPARLRPGVVPQARRGRARL